MPMVMCSRSSSVNRVGPRDADCETRLDVGNVDLLAELAVISAEDYATARRRVPPIARSCWSPAERTA